MIAKGENYRSKKPRNYRLAADKLEMKRNQKEKSWEVEKQRPDTP